MDQSNNKLMDKDRLLQIFDYINEKLKANQLQLGITIYDETVMTMFYDNGPAIKRSSFRFNWTNHFDPSDNGTANNELIEIIRWSNLDTTQKPLPANFGKDFIISTYFL